MKTEETKLGAAVKRVYWIVRNKAELLDDTGQTKDADFDREAWEQIVHALTARKLLVVEFEELLNQYRHLSIKYLRADNDMSHEQARDVTDADPAIIRASAALDQVQS